MNLMIINAARYVSTNRHNLVRLTFPAINATVDMAECYIAKAVLLLCQDQSSGPCYCCRQVDKVMNVVCLNVEYEG